MRFFLIGYRWIGCFLIALGLILGQSTTATAASRLTITWSDKSTNEAGFRVERKTGTTGTYTQIAQVSANITSFIDSTVTAGTTYCYRVRAFNTAGNSAYSNEACGTAATVSFTLTVAKNGNGTVSSSPAGISCGSDCSQTYTSVTSVTLTATPALGYAFSGWSGGGCSGTGTCILLINTNTSVTATFRAPTPTYTLSVTKVVGSGTVRSSPAGISCGTDCSEPYASGTAVSLTATPAAGYVFSGWSGACTGTGTCSVTLSANKTVTATFNAPSFTLVAAYGFNQGSGTITADSSGNGFTGTLNGATWTTQGKYGNAIVFNGSSAYVALGNWNISGSSLTLTAWVRATDWKSTEDVRIISKATGTQEQEHWWMLSETDNKPRFRLKAGGSTSTLVGTSTLPLNTWVHLAATYDGTTMRLYQNGVLVGGLPKTGQIESGPAAINIGRSPVGGHYFSGIIDDVRVYNRTLTAAQITTNMNTAVIP
jgi:uncharacterized repeat protein (TIGR02543 family)